ncbi:hypothetical protein BC937DRAFT_89375 [Endogone sp. FLAS-F59071]|nr:hypothetical protein BC937DRAFT_89375 [Endogone sp. FLAS-F59071]|eukprot:RUS17888.1 hypothetical protein BC937DRAFT_89375 [Endogone sp. FLAS-F59071]
MKSVQSLPPRLPRPLVSLREMHPRHPSQRRRSKRSLGKNTMNVRSYILRTCSG